ncbi:tRNA (adenosine(37)-N6)-threonylcarbamoyltransferase complex dimerization subunit type 1 TsaB [Carboxydothermus pertinax]|uniref:tRNA (Adenosine(37)-N6)-threonylcarbamoyltransferase complex dimerization subunit type 1 TsaB n=1 Tax=Carboxydothermus pertinax TaxID=870242 RepID=A0A1L8CSQ8_9THEO|nr:tRNA (adenosine(37)-N6)-threonylcarbamoyltransferase complex dimerization subunit type 1 TsaB [Carboxydothermus pertinax]GAV21958.1 tRNA (adenosine(37)-N6)-threonylcarbamoyltransferase complex dimerization subunit type 1 TsaB [Carboxydothermus pertinax]
MELAVIAVTRSISLALRHKDEIIFEINDRLKEPHAAGLMPLIDFALRRVKGKPADLQAVYTVFGPGSFTSLRINLATCLGLAKALGIPVYATDTLSLIAANVGAYRGEVMVLMEVNREELYYGRFLNAPKPVPLEMLSVLTLEEVKAKLGTFSGILIGDGANKLGKIPENITFLKNAGEPLARNLFALDLKPVDFLNLKPIYLRKSQAEIMREIRGE